MPFSRPTLAQLAARNRADIERRVPGADAHLRESYEDTLSTVIAGNAHGLHGHLVYLSKQIIFDTAEEEYAVRWADIYGIQRHAPQAAAGPILLTGASGEIATAGSQWRRSDGVIFTLDDDVEMVLGAGIGQVTAAIGHEGKAGNSTPGQTLSIVVPIAGITSTATVADPGLTNGADRESIPALLQRLLLRLQQPPKGGGPGDYVRWAREVAGVTRAWQYKNYGGVGKPGVFFTVDDELDPVPDAAKVAQVQAYIDSKAPITAEPDVFAPIPLLEALVFTLLVPDNAATRAAVTAELHDLWRRKAEPGGTILVSQINESISIAAGEEDHEITRTTNIVCAPGQMSFLDSIEFP